METNSATVASTIRNNAKWPVVITSVLMAITIGSFGISELIHRPKSEDIYLKNWRTSIKAKELQEIFQQNIYFLNYGDQMRNYLNNMAVQTALQVKDAERRKIVVKDQEIKDRISADKTFADENGKFSLSKYNETLSQIYRNISDANSRAVIWEQKVRNEIIGEKLKEAITKDIKPTDKEIREEFHDTFDTADYDYVTFAVDAKKAPEPSIEEIKKHLEANAADPRFMSEKQIKVKYIFFPYKKYVADAPKDEELQAYYEQNKAEFIDSAAKDSANKEPKYKEFKDVKAEITKKVSEQKTKDKAKEVTDKIHTDMSAIVNDKKEVDITKAFEAIKPANGEFGESGYFSKSAGANDISEKFGDATAFRMQALDSLKRATLNRANLEKGILFYMPIKTEVKEPAPKSLEECKPIIAEELKAKKAIEIAEKSANDLIKQSEASNWDAVVKTQNLTAQNHKVIFKEAAGKHKAIATALIDKKVAVGKFTVVPSAQNTEHEFYAVVFKARNAASDEKFQKEKTEIQVSLEASKKSTHWGEYLQGLPKASGMETEENKDEKPKDKK